MFVCVCERERERENVHMPIVKIRDCRDGRREVGGMERKRERERVR